MKARVRAKVLRVGSSPLGLGTLQRRKVPSTEQLHALSASASQTTPVTGARVSFSFSFRFRFRFRFRVRLHL